MNTNTPLEEAIQVCKNWTDSTETLLKIRVATDTNALRDSIKGKLKVRNLEPYAITFSFLRYGAWIEKGAGKGAGGTKGSSWYDKHGKKKSTKPSSLGKMGKVRYYNEWYEYTIEERLPVLADLLSRHLADSIIRYIALR